MSLLISGDLKLRRTWQPMDPDAAAYIAAVETADTQALEQGTKIAIDNFVLGCKEDGVWTAIKASCILAGARTLAGALIPLVGAAPTNFNFVSGDYNRKTGLVGNGSTKYLNSEYTLSSGLQNNNHGAVFISTFSAGNAQYYMAAISSNFHLLTFSSSFTTRNFNGGLLNGASNANNVFGGMSRSTSSSYTVRNNSQSFVGAGYTSSAPSGDKVLLYLQSPSNYTTNARLAFYSIGESLNLALLDARVTALINAFAAAIP